MFLGCGKSKKTLRDRETMQSPQWEVHVPRTKDLTSQLQGSSANCCTNCRDMKGFFGGEMYAKFNHKKSSLTCYFAVTLKEPGGCGVRPAGRSPGAQTGQRQLRRKFTSISICSNCKAVFMLWEVSSFHNQCCCEVVPHDPSPPPTLLPVWT